MFSCISVALSRHLHSIQNHSTRILPHYHLLILRWCALVVLYGETGPGPSLGHNTT
jgi:hypothetical protein